MNNCRITVEGLEALERGLDFADPRLNRLGMKMLEILVRDGEMTIKECMSKAALEIGYPAPRAPTA